MNAPAHTFAAPAMTPALSQEVFDKFRGLIYRKTRINMRDGKQILVSNRLRKRLVHLGLASYEEYYALLTSAEGAPTEMPHFVDAVSTNETYFFRESGHFTSLESHVLPELFRAGRTVRIWSAGCSTGEEAYTLRIVADQAAKACGAGGVEIVGTDISTTVIARARAGVYRDRSLKLVPPDLLRQNFRPAADGGYQVRDEVRARVEFKVHNLFTDPPPGERIDVIFCRNVMIYFDTATQERLVDGIFARAIGPEGYLFIGHAESVTGFSTVFQYASLLRAPIYRRRVQERLREQSQGSR
ncbi:MAG: CheR family methyltransferase [Spirochaetia bacterium]